MTINKDSMTQQEREVYEEFQAHRNDPLCYISAVINELQMSGDWETARILITLKEQLFNHLEWEEFKTVMQQAFDDARFFRERNMH